MHPTYRKALIAMAGAISITVGAARAASAQATSAAKANPAKPQGAPKLKWGPAPAMLPRGAKMAVVSGDPSKSGPFEVQLSMPGGYRIPPHFHPTDETVAVKSGTFRYGMGDKVETAKMQTMKAGQSGTIQANMHHYATARGKTVISISSTGPFATTYVNPADDPTKAAPKK